MTKKQDPRQGRKATGSEEPERQREVRPKAVPEAYLDKAAAGDVQAMYRLGQIYRDGDCGMRASSDQAIKWFREAVSRGNDADAKAELALLYYKRHRYTEALPLLLETADRLESMQCLGQMYRDGRGVVQDEAKAQEWFSKVQAKGGIPHQSLLSKLRGLFKG